MNKGSKQVRQLTVDRQMVVLNSQGILPGLTVQKRKVIDAAGEIATKRPDQVAFQHAILCQVGLPRARLAERTFERTSGSASILVEAGKLWDARSGTWIEEALPYGSKPRLALVHIISEAVRTRSRSVDVGRSLYDFMKTLEIDTNGRSYAAFRQQLSALSACRITLGFGADTIDSKPIERFRAWNDEGVGGEGKLGPESIMLFITAGPAPLHVWRVRFQSHDRRPIGGSRDPARHSKDLLLRSHEEGKRTLRQI